jgi:hypothetical protein
MKGERELLAVGGLILENGAASALLVENQVLSWPWGVFFRAIFRLAKLQD